MITCPKCGRQLHEANGYGISQIVLVDDGGRGVRYCLNCVVAPDPCEECENNNQKNG